MFNHIFINSYFVSIVAVYSWQHRCDKWGDSFVFDNDGNNFSVVIWYGVWSSLRS